jgi:propanol-preferring alcohol dehydrogenase
MKIPQTMFAMLLEKPGTPLQPREVPVPVPGPDQVLLEVHSCGVCRTDLHIMDGELPEPKLPLIMGHQVVGTLVGKGENVKRFHENERIGVPWLGYTDGSCWFCQHGQENLCDHPLFTGYTINGGFCQYTVADQRYCFSLPDDFSDLQVAPLLCAGMIGYRTYRLAGENKQRLGIYGFGAAGHITAQIAIHNGQQVYAFTRPGDLEAQQFAFRIGAVWAGDSHQQPPEKLDAALIFAPVGPLIVEALKATSKGGTVVSGGIHMSDIPAFPYHLLWDERQIRSAANLTRQDGEEFLNLAPQVPIKTEIKPYRLEDANQALNDLRAGALQGAAVLIVDHKSNN